MHNTYIYIYIYIYYANAHGSSYSSSLTVAYIDSAYLMATKSTVLFIITLMWVWGTELTSNGGLVQSRSITF